MRFLDDVLIGNTTTNNNGTIALEEAEEVEQITFLTICLFFATLILSQVLCYLWRKTNQTIVPEAGMLLGLGMVIGAIISSKDGGEVGKAVEQLTSFDSNLFFIVLLPPVIFDSGFTLRREVFFGNFGIIMGLAVFGTILSCIVVGFMMYGFSSIGLVYPATRMECFIFGALISATDPVSVIAVFERLGVKPVLLMLVFGESVLNDAVALVLYRTMVFIEVEDQTDGIDGISVGTQLGAVSEFFTVLIGSVLIGLAIGFVSALIFKYMRLYEDDMRMIEKSIAVLLPYVSYTLSAGLELSGIVSMLFTGIFMASYTRYNLSEITSYFIETTFHFLAHLSETFIFIYLGMTVFTDNKTWNWHAISFGLFGVVACFIGRVVAIYPLCLLVNLFRAKKNQISKAEMFTLWYSGLRGGMAFALAVSSTNEINSDTGKVFQTATTIIVFITVFLCGGSIRVIVEKLNLIDKSLPSPLSSPVVGPKVGGGTGGILRSPQIIGISSENNDTNRNSIDSLNSDDDYNNGSFDVELTQIDITNLENNHNLDIPSPIQISSPRQELERSSSEEEILASRKISWIMSPLNAWNRFDKKVLRPVLLRRAEGSSVFDENVYTTTPNDNNNNNNNNNQVSIS